VSYAGPILDNHFHIQRHGLFLDAVRAFERAGGTHVTHIPIPGKEPKTTRAQWRAFFEDHLAVSDLIEKETNVRVIRAVGPYPIEFVHLAATLGLEAAMDAFREGYEAAFELLRAGRAVVLGEVGRAHFPVPEGVQRALNDMLEEALSLAAEAHVPAILHTEHATVDVFADLSRIANQARFPLDRLIKHYAPPMVHAEENHGLFPSIIASRSAIQEALAKGPRFMMETDFIDEPSRPNVVLPPYSVPKRTKALSEQKVPDEMLLQIHKLQPEKLFQVTIEAGRRVR
jgi:TatD-related deoxyribonuclease